MNGGEIVYGVSTLVAAIGAMLMLLAIGHGIAFAIAGVIIFHDAVLLLLIGFSISGFGVLGAALGKDIEKGEVIV